MLGPDGKIWKPEEKNWPHPAKLAWHRDNIFCQMAAEGSAPWE
jgi:putative restriction endonuclease